MQEVNILNQISTVMITCTFILYLFMARETRKTVAADNMIKLLRYLHEIEFSQARMVVRYQLREKNYKDWTDLEKESVSKVCSSYDLAGFLIRARMINTKQFLKSWGKSICHCYSIMKPFIEDDQGPNLTDDRYWINFIWLHKKANESIPNQ